MEIKLFVFEESLVYLDLVEFFNYYYCDFIVIEDFVFYFK